MDNTGKKVVENRRDSNDVRSHVRDVGFVPGSCDDDATQKQSENDFPLPVYSRETTIVIHEPTAAHEGSWCETDVTSSLFRPEV